VRRRTSKPIVLLAIVAVATVSSWVPRAAGATTPWDPRVEPVARAVERIRGLEFDHPVQAEFLSDSAFRKRVRSGVASLTEQQRRRLEDEAAELRALGLAAGDVDLAEALGQYAGDNVLAYYDASTKRITVRGTELTPATKVVLAHELTHALQDQHFDLTRLDRTAKTSTGAAARQALVEGDATRTELLYLAGLGDEERSQAEEVLFASGGATAPGQGAAADLPDILGAIYEAPYRLGPLLVDSLATVGGTRSIDRALRHPPSSDEGEFDPLTAVTAHETKHVATPALRKGESKVGARDDFGAFSLYLFLASRLDTLRALQAADGWAGDAELAFRRNGTRCLRVAFAGHSRTDTARIATALREATAELPSGSTEVRDLIDRAELTACDPGTVAEEATPFAEHALAQLEMRNTAIASGLGAGLDVDQVRCLADRLTQDELWQEVGTTSTEPSDAELDVLWDRWESFVTACREAPSP
jgi:hypothetical protein